MDEQKISIANQCDKILLKKLDDLIDILNWIDDEITSNSEKNSNVDSELSDWLHLVENNNLTDKELLEIMKKIKELRLKRRSVKNEYFLLNAYKENKIKLIHQAQRDFFRNEIMNKWYELNMPYNNRVITDKDVDEIVKEDIKAKEPTQKKRGRKPKEFLTTRDGTEYSATELKQMLLEVGTQRKLAEKINVGQPALSLFLRKRGVKTYSKKRKKKGDK